MRKILLMAVLSALSAGATSVVIDFGSGMGVTSPAWPGTSTADIVNTGVSLGASSLTLDVGELTMSGNGTLFCVVGITAGTCGTVASVATNNQSAGLGVSDGRVNLNDVLTLTRVNPGFNITLVSFTLSNFGAASASEQAQYSIDGGAQNIITSPGVNVPLDTFLVNQAFMNTVVFSVPTGGGNWSFATLTLDVTAAAVPEPGTLSLMGLALAGLGLAYRRRSR